MANGANIFLTNEEMAVLEEFLSEAILKTPTSRRRNVLADIQITVMASKTSSELENPKVNKML